jgi:hypothetical protein
VPGRDDVSERLAENQVSDAGQDEDAVLEGNVEEVKDEGYEGTEGETPHSKSQGEEE